MKRRMNASRWIWAILIGILLVGLRGPSFAKENQVVRTQGLINPGGNLKAGYLLINEMRVHLDVSTSIKDAWGNVISATELKARNWVYLEMERNGANQLKAKRIYLLPHYVNPEERKSFAFMK